MVASCSAYNCVQRYEKGVSFHGFPRDEELKKKWIRAMQRDNFIPSKQSKLCSKHFSYDCYDTSPWSSQKKLKNDAVPSVFDFPINLKTISKPRKPPKNREPAIPNDQCESLQIPVFGNNTQMKPTACVKSKRYIGDIKEDDMASPENAKECLKLAVNEIVRNRKSIKILQQTKRRLLKRVKDLNSLVNHLKQNSMVTEEVTTTLMASMSESAKQLFCRVLLETTKKCYPPELRSFALTLNFYSPKAYSYVRKTFSNAIPHPRTIQKWYESVESRVITMMTVRP